MNTIDLFLVQYGLAAFFLLMFVKSAGVPIPIPADIILLAAAVRVSQGKFVLWQAFIVILLAVVLGGLIQFVLASGPGRGLLYRFGRYLGLTPTRLDAASARVKKGGILGMTVAILVPGVRGVAIAASGLAGIPLRTFVPGLVLGSTLFLSIHFFLGYLGGTLFAVIGQVLPSSLVVVVILVLLAAAFALWMLSFRRQKVAQRESEAASLEVWHEGICPICLALYTASQLRTSSIDGLR